MSKDTNELLGHSEDNDGIEEYDNPLPDWWLGLFLFTIVWGFGYWVDWNFIGQHTQAGIYDAEMVAAAEQWPEQEAPAAGDIDQSAAAIAAGEAVFTQNCVACHAADLTGGIGPNLVDAEWIHGGSIEEIRTIIDKGVPEKGMVTWGPILGQEKVSQVAAYVKSKGTK